MEGMEGSNSRVGRVDVLDGNTSFNGAKSISSWLVAHLVAEDGHTAILVLELSLVLLHHLRLRIKVHADDAAICSAHHTKGEIL